MTEESANELMQSDALSRQPDESAAPANAPFETAEDATQLTAASDLPTSDLPSRATDVPPASFPQGEPTPLQIAVSALSDMGCVRTNNEDSFGYDEQLGIYVVCDGMGGMASGEVASSRAVAAIVSAFAESASSGVPISSRLLHALTTANQDVWDNAQVPENRGMGTTAVAAARDGDKLVLGNVGDSRAYIIQDGQCVQLTVDHSYINELIRNGTLTIESAKNADLQGYESVITRAVGVAANVEPDFYSVDLNPGTAVLLTTDGLTRYLSADEIAAVLHASSFESACANLIDLAKQRGGHDNITCILLLATSA